MSDQDPPQSGGPPAPGWWQASDGNWYPAEQHPDRREPPVPGWWLASDGNWYPPDAAQVAPSAPGASQPVAPMPPDGPPAVPPASPPASAVGPPATPASQAMHGAATAPTRSAPLLIGAAAVALVIAGLGVFLLLRSSDDDSTVASERDAGEPAATVGEPDDSPAGGDGSSTTPTDDGGDASASFSPGVDECVYLGPDAFDDLHAELRFTMPFDNAGDLTVDFGLVDGAGQRFLSSSAFIEAAQPGEAFRFDADTLEELPPSVADPSAVTCELLGIEDLPFDPPEVPADADCQVVGVDSFGDVQVELTVSNESGAQADLSVDYALRGDGLRFGSGFTFVDQVPPGETVRSPDDSFTDAPRWADELTCEIIDVDAFDF